MFPIRVSPLRERKEEIPELTNHFISKFGAELRYSNTFIDEGSLELLRKYDWPGNVRELENVIRQSLLYSGGNGIKEDIVKRVLTKGKIEVGEKSFEAAVRETLEETGLKAEDMRIKNRFKAYEKYFF